MVGTDFFPVHSPLLTLDKLFLVTDPSRLGPLGLGYWVDAIN
jgi:hypothetical protein